MATTSVYDPYGRMRHVIADSAGVSAGTRNNRTSYAYDALDRLTSTSMPGGGTTRYAYDTLGRMVSRHHPDADAATLFKYDDLGRLRFSQDARQRAAGTGATRKITYTVYDDFGRVIRVGEAAANFASLDPERSYPFENDASSWRSRMTYDGGDGSAAGGGTTGGGANYAQGRLVKVEENTDADAAAEVVHRYAYDHLGNVRVKKVMIDGLTGDKTVEYAHDLAGRVTRLIYPGGSQARYAYDGAGRLSRVWDAQGNTLTRYTHTAAGNIATHVVGEGAGEGIVTGAYTYNPREWVTGIDYAGTFSSTLTYDLAGNVTRQVYGHGAAASRTADYAYDNLFRITGFDLTGGVSEDFTYDRSGNIKSMVSGGSTLTYKYSPASTPNRLDSLAVAGAVTRYAYNANGWMTGRGTATLTYDYRGLTTGFGSARYLMDPDRRRVKKTAGTVTTYYLRGADGSVLAEYDRNQALTARYVYAGVRRIARLAADGGKNYYLTDHLGSTRSLVDGSGTVTAAYDYRPYGKVLAASGTDATRFRFTGHERDDESGLDYMLERSYAYDIGRFLRPDPMQDDYPGISPYAYAANNPLKYVDPDGRIAIVPVLVAGWALAELGLSAYDVYDAVSTALDPDATTGQKLFSAGGALAGVVLPGGGYSAVDDLAQVGKSVITSSDNRVVREGIYEFKDKTGRPYVGQSSDVNRRLAEHARTGKLPSESKVTITDVPGGRTAREIAEHNRIQQITDEKPARLSKDVSNKRDPIGKNRRHLLDEQQ